MLDSQEGGHVLRTVGQRAQRGMTLIEVMVTVAILAILVSLASPAIGDWLLNAQIRTAAEALQNGLMQARTEAVRRNAPVEFVLGAGSTWTISLAVGHTALESRQSSEGSQQVVLAVEPAGATTVTFDGMGRRWGDPATGKNLDAGKTAQLSRICVDLPAAVLPAARTRNLELDISLSGEVRMCDPEVSSATDNRYCVGYPTSCT